MDDNKLLNLVLMCIPLSLVSFGGGQSIIAGLQHQTVELQHLITAREFTDFYAISRAAPGPGTLIVALIGYHINGIWGALAATAAIFLPSTAVVCIFGSLWHRHRQAAWAIATERGLAPVAAGLIFAGAFTVAQSAQLTLIEIGTVAAAVAILSLTKLSAYPILAVAAVGYFLLSMAGLA
jgi:chromate transporter